MSNILIVDDSQENLFVLSRLLTEHGYQVRPAINGQIALKAIDKFLPDLILLDILMPELDGFEVCRRLQAQKKTRDIPIIFLSALNAASEKVQAFSIGGVDYITKPFQPEEVVARVKTHLALHQMRKELQQKNTQLHSALENVSTLNGLLPICANCKKIRDDRGYWNQLERYIETHSEVLFSHGLCPECLKQFSAEITTTRDARNEFRKHAMTIQKSNLLIVDDTPANLTTLTKILSQEHYQVRPAITGQVALKTIRVVPPDLILLDIMLPDMDGYELCQQLKADDTTRDIPVIFISALDRMLDKLKAFQVGGVDYITKPFQPEEVLARVKAHIHTRTMQQDLQRHNLQLQHEIHERTRAEEALHERNRELAILHRMSHTLQKCQTEQETYHVIAGACQQILPELSGHIGIPTSSHGTFHSVISWGVTSPMPQNLPCETLWQNCQESSDTEAPPDIIFHIKYCAETDTVWVPVLLEDDVLSMLIFSPDRNTSTQGDNHWRHLIKTREMALNGIVEYYALSLINLRLRETLRLEAIHDPLTGLYNRRYMYEALERELQLMKRQDNPLALILLDIDHFKHFNDSYGHDLGDVVLQEVGRLLHTVFRRSDIACRYGGEEFLIILPHASLTDAYSRSDEARKQIHALSIPYQRTTLHITISAGVAAFPQHGERIEDVIRMADQALYQAKKQGRNQVVSAA